MRNKGNGARSECSALQNPPIRRPYTTCCLAERPERPTDLCARLRASTPCAREPRYSTRAGARSSTIAFCGEEEEEESVKEPCLTEAAATRKDAAHVLLDDVGRVRPTPHVLERVPDGGLHQDT